jgi:flavorubredoxin
MKIFIGIIVVVVVLIVLSQIMRLCFTSYLNTQKGSSAEVLSNNRQPSKKALVIYQPGITGISSRMAHQIAMGLSDGGYEVTLNYPGEHLSADASRYQIIVFGSPVYSGQPSKALTDFISKVKVSSDARIALYSTGGFKFYMELDIMDSALHGAKAYRKIKFFTSGKSENDKKAYDLGKELSKE